MHTIPQDLKDFLDHSPLPSLHSYEGPVNDFDFTTSDQLDRYQLGYRVNGNTCEDLTGNELGMWHPNWFVIGVNFAVGGDPVFVDITEGAIQYPLYTAMHGAGAWEPIVLANSIPSLVQIISVLDEELEKETFSSSDFLSRIGPLTTDLAYWGEKAAAILEEIEEEL